jgi:hypothetical protein
VVLEQGVVTSGRVGREMEDKIWTNIAHDRFDVSQTAHVSLAPRPRTRNSYCLDTLLPEQLDQVSAVLTI